MIDVHTHLFNLAYLPAHGILRAWDVPNGLAAPAARVLGRLTRVDESPAGFFDTTLAGALQTEVEVTTPDLVLGIAQTVDEEELSAMHDDLVEAMSVLDAMTTADLPADDSPTLLLELGMLGGDRERLLRLLRAVGRFIAGGMATLRWFLLMLNRETAVVEHLLATWPETRLFVHHMMDMDNHYPPGGTRFASVAEQVQRMQALVARWPGRFVTFAAFDPFREDGLELVRDAIEGAGCAGVKFYPPNGYKPIGNTSADVPGQDAAVVNARNLALFRWCVADDVPILVHCTPHGMESRRHVTGKFSDPERWLRVLEMDGLSSLRLCLAHAGGDEGWTAPHSSDGDVEWARSYACSVVELCVRFPSVYCEFGHLDALLRAEKRARMIRRLERIVVEYGDAIASKLMYGSDWHLLARVPEHRELPQVLRAALRGSAILSPLEVRLFSANAEAYLATAGPP